MKVKTSDRDLEKRVQKVLDDAIELADLGGRRIPAHEIAERVFENALELMEEVRRPWTLERLACMIARRRRARRVCLRWRQLSP